MKFCRKILVGLAFLTRFNAAHVCIGSPRFIDITIVFVEKKPKKYLLLGTNNREHSRHLQLVRLLSRMNSETVQASWPYGNSLRYKAFTKKWSSLAIALRPVNIITILRFQAKLLFLERGSEVLLEHPSQLNFIIAFPIVKLRKHKITTDFYVGLHDTLVMDRELIKKGGLLAKILRMFDRFTLKNSDRLIFASYSDRQRFSKEAGIPFGRSAVLLPSPPDFFKPVRTDKPKRDVIFVGEFSPLMGLEVVLDCIKMPSMSKFAFTIVGTGQDSPKISQIAGLENVKILDWVDYQKLPELYANHKLSLGIFGSSEKAKSVFPNKVMESLRVGVPCISASPEIQDFFGSKIGVHLAAHTNSNALAESIIFLLSDDGHLQMKSKQCLVFSSRNGSDSGLSKDVTRLLGWNYDQPDWF